MKANWLFANKELKAGEMTMFYSFWYSIFRKWFLMYFAFGKIFMRSFLCFDFFVWMFVLFVVLVGKKELGYMWQCWRMLFLWLNGFPCNSMTSYWISLWKVMSQP
jgi:hypothetical protein